MPTPEQVAQALRRQAQDQDAPPSVVTCQPAKTWIEVKLLDAEGNPVRAKTCVITLPGGAVERRALDGNGTLRVDGVEPGTCMVSFPELDGNAWERI